MKIKETNLSLKNRKMLLTINNPQKEETTSKGFLFEENALNDALNGNERAKVYIIDRVKNYIDNSTIIKGKTNVYYCFSLEVGKQGETPHLHIYFQFENGRVGNTIKGIFPTAHIDYCGGSNTSIRDYVFKTGKKWEGSEKEETRIDGVQYENSELPEERGQGSRSDLDTIKELIDNGKTPREILEMNPNNYKFDKYIGEMFYNKRLKETPMKRDVNVIVHVGVAGSGKTNVLTKLNEEKLFIGADYSSALFDNYEGQEVLFLDEFRGQIPYNQLLLILDGYKVPIHARYYNKYSLWNDVHITSVIPFEEWYDNDNIRDTFEQLKRRVSMITYHFMTDCNNVFIPDKIEYSRTHDKSQIMYHEYTINAEQYVDYETLEQEALSACGAFRAIENDDFCNLPSLTLDQEFEEWKKGSDPFNVMTEEQLWDMFWSEKVRKSEETVA